MFYVVKKHMGNSLKMFKITCIQEEVAEYINHPSDLFSLTAYTSYYEAAKNIIDYLSFQDKYDFGIEDCQYLTLGVWYIRSSDNTVNFTSAI